MERLYYCFLPLFGEPGLNWELMLLTSKAHLNIISSIQINFIYITMRCSLISRTSGGQVENGNEGALGSQNVGGQWHLS